MGPKSLVKIAKARIEFSNGDVSFWKRLSFPLNDCTFVRVWMVDRSIRFEIVRDNGDKNLPILVGNEDSGRYRLGEVFASPVRSDCASRRIQQNAWAEEGIQCGHVQSAIVLNAFRWYAP